MSDKRKKKSKVKKVPASINIQKSLSSILSKYNISGLTSSFNVFFAYFEPIIDYICEECSKDKEFIGTSINLPEERLEKLKNLVKFKIFGNFTEAIRFVYLLGVCELYRDGNLNLCNIPNLYEMFSLERLKTDISIVPNKKEIEEKALSEEMQEMLKKVISIDEYRSKMKEESQNGKGQVLKTL